MFDQLPGWTNQNQGKSYNLNLTIPISYVEENMKRAEVRDAVTQQKFYFRYFYSFFYIHGHLGHDVQC